MSHSQPHRHRVPTKPRPQEPAVYYDDYSDEEDDYYQPVTHHRLPHAHPHAHPHPHAHAHPHSHHPVASYGRRDYNYPAPVSRPHQNPAELERLRALAEQQEIARLTADLERLRATHQDETRMRTEAKRLADEQRRNEEEIARLREEEARVARDTELALKYAEATKPFECSICFSTLPREDIFVTEACNHSFCIFCVREHAKVAVRNMSSSVMCPENGCNTPLFRDEVEILLTPEEMDRFEMNVQRSIRDALDDYYQCNGPDCSYGFILEGDEVFISCPECGHTRCIHCNVPPHHGINCEQYQQWAKDNKAGDILIDQMKEAGFFRVCPSCHNGVQKSDGCNRLACRCGTNFCYVCSADIGTANPYGHFGGACPLRS